MLPLAESVARPTFERHFGTPHDLELCEVVSGFGIPCHTVEREKELVALAGESLSRPGVEVVRVGTRRQQNADLHGRMFRAVEAALQAWV